MPRNMALKGGSANLRKVKIKPFSKPPTLPPNFYEETSQELLHGTLNVLQREKAHHQQRQEPSQEQSPSLSLQNSYNAVVNLVTHQFGPRLYHDLRQAMQQAAKEVLPNPEKGAADPSTSMLEFVQTQYQLFVDYLLLCKHVFLPLDRTHLWQEDGQTVVKRTMATSHTHYTLWEVGLCQFRDRLNELKLDETVYQQWFQMLRDDWAGNFAQRSLLQATWHMWQDLHLLPLIMIQLQPDLEKFLQRESQQAIESSSGYAAANFVSYVYEKWMHMSYQWTFLPKTWLCTLLEVHLLLPHLHQDWLLAPQHFYPLLEEELLHQPGPATPNKFASPGPSASSTGSSYSQSAMVKLWMLAGRLPNGYKQVATCIAEYARTKGVALVQQNQPTPETTLPTPVKKAMTTAANQHTMIADLLELQQQLSRLVQKLLHGTDHISLKSVWEEIVNFNATPTIAESLAKFVDQILKNNKKMDQYALQQGPQATLLANGSVSAAGNNSSSDLLFRIISGIFVHLQAKDIFEAFYKRDLAKRLLWNRVVSMDVEKQFVSLLKAECGAGYTSKMEGMFQDVDWSREAMSRYKQTLPMTGNAGGVEMEAQVLTTGYWPVYPQYPHLILPESLKEPQERFTNHYKTKYQGRRMTWQYALGHCIVRANGLGRSKSKIYELVMSLCQALVLIQFQSPEDKFTLLDLKQKIGLDERDEMERILQSLALGKDGTRVLRKLDHDAEPNKKKKIRLNVDDRDKFTINMSFDSNQRRIRVTNIMWKETKEEREKTVEAVSRDRLYMIDAALVRIMKARKTIFHQQLIPQVLEQVKVPAQPADVKKRIESLIEREYMERDTKDRSRYNYLA
jgi:Cullin family/Cullin protein neddylation domain